VSALPRKPLTRANPPALSAVSKINEDGRFAKTHDIFAQALEPFGRTAPVARADESYYPYGPAADRNLVKLGPGFPSTGCPIMSAPISLSDHAMDQVIALCRPLTPLARTAFLEALAIELRFEPQPCGDGVVLRCARTLLKTGMY
jgi:hypothetical protein